MSAMLKFAGIAVSVVCCTSASPVITIGDSSTAPPVFEGGGQTDGPRVDVLAGVPFDLFVWITPEPGTTVEAVEFDILRNMDRLTVLDFEIFNPDIATSPVASPRWQTTSVGGLNQPLGSPLFGFGLAVEDATASAGSTGTGLDTTLAQSDDPLNFNGSYVFAKLSAVTTPEFTTDLRLIDPRTTDPLATTTVDGSTAEPLVQNIFLRINVPEPSTALFVGAAVGLGLFIRRA